MTTLFVSDTMSIKLIETGEYISLEETLSVLKILPNTLETMLNKKHEDNYFIKYFVCAVIKVNVCKVNRRYFCKSDIEILKEKQLEFVSTHISIQVAHNRYATYFKNHSKHMKDNLKSYTVPLYAKIIDSISDNSYGFKAYKINEIEKCIYELNTLQEEKEQNHIYYNNIKIMQYIKKNDELFISIKDSLSILETTKDALRNFNISSISTANGNTKYYNYNEILNLINEVEVYFKKYYTIRQVKSLLPESYYKTKLNKIFIPKIYRQILINTLHEGNLPSEIAFDKDDVNNWLQKIEEKKAKNKAKMESIEKSKNDIEENLTIKLIESGQYITKQEASSILDIEESTFEKMVNVKYKKLYPIKFLIGNVYKTNISRTGTNYYCKSDIDKLNDKQHEFINNYILPVVAYDSILKDCTLTSIRTLKLHEIPLYARTKKFPKFSIGCRKAYKTSELKEYLKNAKFLDTIKRKTKEELKVDIYFSKLEVCNLLEITVQNVTKKINQANINSTFFGIHPYYLKEDVNKYISSAKFFIEKHYSESKVEKMLSSNNYILLQEKIKTIIVPVEYRHIFRKSYPNFFMPKSKIAYDKIAVDNFLKEQEEIKNKMIYKKNNEKFDSSIIYNTSSNGYSTLQVRGITYTSKLKTLKTLDISNVTLSKLIKLGFINTYVFKNNITQIKKNTVFYNKNDILDIIAQQTEFYNTNISIIDAVNLYDEIYSKSLLKKHLKAVNVPFFAYTNYYKNSKTKLFFNKLELDQFVKSQQLNLSTLDNNLNNTINLIKIKEYISRQEALEILNISNYAFKKLICDENISNFLMTATIPLLAKKNTIFYNKNDILDIKAKQTEFYNSNISIIEAVNLYDKTCSCSTLKKHLKAVDVPFFAYTNFHKDNRINLFFNKLELDQFVKSQPLNKLTISTLNDNLDNNINKIIIDKNKFPIIDSSKNKIIVNDNTYISKKEVLNILNINEKILPLLKKTENIDSINSIKNSGLKKATYFNEKDILELKDKQNEFLKSYILIDDVINTYPKNITKYILEKHVKKTRLPLYARTDQLKLSHPSLQVFNQNFYNKLDIENYICNYNKNKFYEIPTSIYGRTSFETFQLRLTYIPTWNGFDSESTLTEKLWFNYVENFLKSSVSKNKTLNNVINSFVRDTPNIKEMIDRYSISDIYLLSSNKINLFLKTLPAQKYRKSIYHFLKYYYAEMSYLKTSGIKCLYRMADIENPHYSYENEIDDSKDVIYDFETYCKVFNYETDIKLHVSTSLNEIFSLGTATYLSTWLYVMLHLNNAWRHGDVVNFPVLSNIEELLLDTNINGLDWFINNEIELALARTVIQRIRSWEMIISKTQIKGIFFCSDELAPAISTSILMLTLYKLKFGILNKNQLMSFNNSSNEVTKIFLKTFFKKINLKNFKFYSRKFNKTIMTFLFYLSNISGDSNALLYAQEIRKHKDSNSTLHYLNFDTKAIETLSKQLFQRGEFGYIPSMLVQLINNGKTDSFEILTEQSSYLKEILGGIPKINSTVGFLNAIRYEHNLVVNTLNSMSFEDLQKCLTNIYTESMPAPDDESLMCLFSNNRCQNIDSKCFECPFHIPTIYTLSLLCDSISKDIKVYNTNTNEASEYKLALSIIKKKTTLAQAIKQFGKDYVYGCLGMPKDDFINELITFNISSRNTFNME